MLGVDDLVDALQRLNDDLEIPRLATLAERDRFDAVTGEMAEAALESGSPGFNPRVPGRRRDRRAVRRRVRRPDYAASRSSTSARNAASAVVAAVRSPSTTTSR